MAAAIETHELTKRYRHQTGLTDMLRSRSAREKLAVDGVTLTIEPGELFGLLGPNGSGKTTFLKMLSTILSPTSGTAKVLGLDVVRDGREVRRMIALVTGEERSLYWRLTARQNLGFFARLYGLDAAEAQRRIEDLLERFDLRDAGDQRVNELSTGMKQKLAIARGLLSAPRLLFLDEPTRGLDPIAAHSLLMMVKERVIDCFDNTVILTTHIMREVEQLCTRVGMLRQGRLVFCGSLPELKSSVREHERYLLRLDRVPEGLVESLTAKAGILGCHLGATDADGTELALTLVRGSSALSAALRCVGDLGLEVRECTRQEQSLEETFRSVFAADAGGTHALRSRA